MNYSIVNLKIDPKTKREAQLVAQEIGVPLSTLLKSYLKQLVRTKKVTFDVSEEPSEYLVRSLEEVKKDRQKGYVSPTFTSTKEAINWLDNPERKYENQIRKKVR